MRENKFNQIVGYLKAFERINTYCNHICRFDFSILNYCDDLQSSIISHLKAENERLKKSMINFNKEFDENITFEFQRILNWQEVLSKGLEFYFLDVFSSCYTEKYTFAKEERANCVLGVIKMLIELFTDYEIDVWASGTETYYSSLTEYYSECSGMDFAFLCGDKLYLLHMGIYD